MDLYSLLLFGHITFVIIWLGSGLFLQLLADRFDRTDDAVALEKIFESTEHFANTLFVPSSLVVVATGIGLTIDGSWSFGDLWVVLGLVGFVLTFLMGSLWLGPQSGRIKKVIERDGGMSAEAQAMAKRMLTVARIDTVVLFLVVFDMSVKPGGNDTGTLILMAAVLVAGAALFTWRAHSVGIEPTEPGPTATA